MIRAASADAACFFRKKKTSQHADIGARTRPGTADGSQAARAGHAPAGTYKQTKSGK